MTKKVKIWGGISAVLLFIGAGLFSTFGLQLFDRSVEAYRAADEAAIEAVQRFIAVNNNETHYSYALNSPVSGDTLYIHWKWARHTGGEYCYYYTIDGADIANNYYHARVAGKCNPEGFSLADQPEGFGFNSSLGVKLPYMMPTGNYTVPITI